MESGTSMPHTQGLSDNPYREPNQPNSSRIVSHGFNFHFFKFNDCKIPQQQI